MDPATNRELHQVYRAMLDRYGPQHWWPGESPFEVMVGAVLTQSTNWRNVEKAIANLKMSGVLDIRSLAELPGERIAPLVRPSGYYNVKAKKLKAMCQWLMASFGGSLDNLFALDALVLRQELLNVYGIGEETADSIILYAGGKPLFVIDAYTRRIMGRLKLGPADGRYAGLQSYFMGNLPHDSAFFNEYHALFVKHGKDFCRKTAPRCPECCLARICARQAEATCD